MNPDITSILSISLLTVLASLVGTAAGFGLSTVMIPIVTFFLPIPQALLLVGIIHWFGDLWKMLLFKRGLRLQSVAAFVIPAVMASFAGALLTVNVDEELLTRLIGTVIGAYALFLIVKPAFILPRRTSAMVAGGAVSGFLTGAFGIAGGAIRGAFLAAYNLPKETYIATAGAIAVFVDSTRLVTYVAGGPALPSFLWWGLLLFIPASFVGASVAKGIVTRIPQQKFRALVAVFLLLVGLRLILL
jgi:hypothetical protein